MHALFLTGVVENRLSEANETLDGVDDAVPRRIGAVAAQAAHRAARQQLKDAMAPTVLRVKVGALKDAIEAAREAGVARTKNEEEVMGTFEGAPKSPWALSKSVTLNAASAKLADADKKQARKIAAQAGLAKMMHEVTVTKLPARGIDQISRDAFDQQLDDLRIQMRSNGEVVAEAKRSSAEMPTAAQGQAALASAAMQIAMAPELLEIRTTELADAISKVFRMPLTSHPSLPRRYSLPSFAVGSGKRARAGQGRVQRAGGSWRAGGAAEGCT